MYHAHLYVRAPGTAPRLIYIWTPADTFLAQRSYPAARARTSPYPPARARTLVVPAARSSALLEVCTTALSRPP